jgi:hypothetical protein
VLTVTAWEVPGGVSDAGRREKKGGLRPSHIVRPLDTTDSSLTSSRY